MRRKLSQRHQATSLRAAAGLLAAALIAGSTGCPRQTPDTDGEDRSSAANGGLGSPDGAAESYHWPHDRNNPVVRLEIEMADAGGEIAIELMPELAPKSVQRIIELVDGGHYDGTTFHRVIRGFMIQGGDPNTRDLDPANDGQGGGDHVLPDEFSAAPFVRGVVALANRGRSTSNSSQFFIIQAENRALDGQYTAIGRVVAGIELVDEIANAATDGVGRWGPKDRPIENIVIRRASNSGRRRLSTASTDLEVSRSFLPDATSLDLNPTSGVTTRRLH